MGVIQTKVGYGKKKRKQVGTDMGIRLQQKFGKRNNECTIKGVNTDLFLWINGIRSIESIKTNKGAYVSIVGGKSGTIYFGSFASMGKIKVYANNRMTLYYPKYLTIISFF